MKKRALITGCAGQDGSYLAELLVGEGMDVFGLERVGADLRHVPEGVQVLTGDLADADSLRAAVTTAEPHEVYNLAGITDLKTAYERPDLTWKVNCEAVATLFEASAALDPAVRFLQASSSETFLPSEAPLDEGSSRDWETKNPYAKAKLAVDRNLIENVREEGGFACSAILFNHESPRRPETSVLRKVCRMLVRIKLGQASTLALGNVDQSRDWGFAGDYARAMRAMLRRDVAEDLVIATGELHTVREAVDLAVKVLDMSLEWRGEGLEACAYDATGRRLIEVDPAFYRPNEARPKVGNAAKARQALGWSPSIGFADLVRMMVEAELADLSRT